MRPWTVGAGFKHMGKGIQLAAFLPGDYATAAPAVSRAGHLTGWFVRPWEPFYARDHKPRPPTGPQLGIGRRPAGADRLVVLSWNAN